MEPTRVQLAYIKCLLAWTLFTSTLVLVLNWTQPIKHAGTAMGFGLVMLWIVVSGGLMVRYREVLLRAANRPLHGLPWQIRFVLFCTTLALIEEAITTSMTNSAPLFGLKVGQAYITAGSNYFDVIAFHGVSRFVSFFVGWAVLLTRWRFSPTSVFLLFGITGTFIEVVGFGVGHIMEYGMWSFVYGLMIWLPACAVPSDRPCSVPRWYHYPFAVFAPFAFMFLFPLLGVISLFSPHHPHIHFAPKALEHVPPPYR